MFTFSNTDKEKNNEKFSRKNMSDNLADGATRKPITTNYFRKEMKINVKKMKE